MAFKFFIYFWRHQIFGDCMSYVHVYVSWPDCHDVFCVCVRNVDCQCCDLFYSRPSDLRSEALRTLILMPLNNLHVRGTDFRVLQVLGSCKLYRTCHWSGVISTYMASNLRQVRSNENWYSECHRSTAYLRSQFPVPQSRKIPCSQLLRVHSCCG